MEYFLDTLIEALSLKRVPRTGWCMRGVETPESVADHSWGTALLVLMCAPAGLDVSRALAMATVHDLAEARVGDIPWNPAGVGQQDKEAQERRAIAELARDPATRGLWEEYTAGTTREAQFVRDMNLLDMCFQALHYESTYREEHGHNSRHFAEFFTSTEARLCTSEGQDLFTQLRQRYDG